MKIIIIIVTGIVTVAALVVAWLSFSSAQKDRTTLDGLVSKHQRFESELKATRGRLAGATHDEAELRTALQQLQAETPKPVAPVQKSASATSPGRPDLSALMEANPELRDLFKRSFQANLGLRYLPLYRAANFSAEQIQKFEAAMTEAEQDRLDLQAIAKTQGLANNDPAIAKLRQQMDDKLKAAQTDALGDTGYQQLQEYKRKEPLLGFVQGAASLMASTPTPLTAAQAEQLLGTLADSSTSYQKGEAANIGNVDWPKVLQTLQPVLPPAQFDLLKANSKNGEVFALITQFYQQRAPAQK